MGKGVGKFMVSDRWLFKLDDLPQIARDPDYKDFCDLPADYFVFAERDGYYIVVPAILGGVTGPEGS